MGHETRPAAGHDRSGDEVKAASATLNATIVPNGLSTTYRFEYGTTTSYGASVPVPDQWIGSNFSPAKASKAITGLASKTTYNFRVVATSSSGATKGVNKTFTTP